MSSKPIAATKAISDSQQLYAKSKTLLDICITRPNKHLQSRVGKCGELREPCSRILCIWNNRHEIYTIRCKENENTHIAGFLKQTEGRVRTL